MGEFQKCQPVSAVPGAVHPIQWSFHGRALVELVSRGLPKASSGQRWDVLEVNGARVCDSGIKDVMLGLVHD